jgi:lipopolysaccharide transport system ATP-binding protein
MQVRLAFAVAAHLEPEILIIDEVLSVGDAEFQRKCLGKMQDVTRGGRTVLFVSHNMAAVRNFCDRSVVLCDGRIAFEGDTESAIRSYLAQACREQGDVELDLRAHPTRRAWHETLLQQVRLLDSNGSPSTVFRSGENVIIELLVDPVVPLPSPHFGIGFADEMGTRLFTVATYFSETTLSSISRPTTVRCSIECLPLAPGQYMLSFNAGTGRQTWVDRLDNVVRIEVQEGDFFGNGRSVTKKHGSLLVRSQWSKGADARAVFTTVGLASTESDERQ